MICTYPRNRIVNIGIYKGKSQAKENGEHKIEEKKGKGGEDRKKSGDSKFRCVLLSLSRWRS